MRKTVITAVVLIATVALLFVGGTFFVPWQTLLRPTFRCSDCNVILISIDTLRSDHLGCYGYDRRISPNVDALANDGIRFLTTIAQASSTLPSHASMLTSLIPTHHGAFFGEKTRIPDTIPTLATVLASHGFSTVSYNGGAQISPVYGLGRGFDVYETLGGRGFSTTVDRALEWISNHNEERIFLFLHTYEVHYPFIPKPNHLKALEPSYGGKLPRRINKKLLMRINSGEVQLADKDKRHIINAYDAEIRSMDEALGSFVDSLKALGLYENSIIIFTSDHGEEFGEHGMMGWHGHTMFDELLKVPLIIKLPNSLSRGSEVTTQARSLDIPPTVLDIIGIDAPETFEGSSLMRLVRPPKLQFLLKFLFKKNEVAVSQKDMGRNALMSSIRTPRWKLDLFQHKGNVTRERLFDLLNDPGELTDVSSKNPDTVQSLRDDLAKILRSRETPEPVKAVVDEVTQKRLQALGYME